MKEVLTTIVEKLDLLFSLPVDSLATLDTYRREWLGKEGTLKNMFRELKDFSPEERVEVSKVLNTYQERLEEFFDQNSLRLKTQAEVAHLKEEFVDLSLPGTAGELGSLHPVSRVEKRLQEILNSCGFSVVQGPELETEYYCFDALNIPKHHPARDLQDTFYTESGKVLRTHSTSVQSRVLEKKEYPLKVASMGRTYRNEKEDADHRAMFHQFELIWLEKNIGLSHLTGLINYIIKALYGRQKKIRFVSKFYPYTEPSIGAQIESADGHWATVGGAGVIHPAVLRGFGYNPAEVQGVAFGLGTSRLAAQFFDMGHLREVYANDIRVLQELV